MAGFIVKVIPQGTKKPETLDLSGEVLTFKFEDEESKADKLTLTVNNFDLRNFDNPIWAEGNLLRITWGDERAVALERELVIKNVKGSLVLNVEALAKSVLMNQERKARTFDHKTYSQIASSIATEHGYSADKQHIDDSEIVWPCIPQAGVSDAMFLRSLANKLHWEWYVDFDGFHFHPRRLGQRPIRTLTYYLQPGLGDIETFNIENDLTAKPKSPSGAVQVKGRDPKKKKKIDVTADNTTAKNRDTTADVIKVVDKATGARTLQKNNVVTTSKTTTAPTEAAAKQQAQGAFIKSQQRTVQLTWTGPGFADLQAKSIVEIVFPGVKSITGRYYITSIAHELSASTPYKISVKARRDGTTALGNGAPGGAKEAKVEGKPNQKDPAKPGELTRTKAVNPATGVRTTVYKDTKGRS